MKKQFQMTGGCQCGSVRYEVNSEQDSVAYFCHCRMCQKAVGNIFITFAKAMKGDLAWIKGEPKYYSSSKFARRGFCSDCGTPLTFEYLNSKCLDLTVGNLDDPGKLEPKWRTGVESLWPKFENRSDLDEHRTEEDSEYVSSWKKEYGEHLMPGEFPTVGRG